MDCFSQTLQNNNWPPIHPCMWANQQICRTTDHKQMEPRGLKVDPRLCPFSFFYRKSWGWGSVEISSFKPQCFWVLAAVTKWKQGHGLLDRGEPYSSDRHPIQRKDTDKEHQGCGQPQKLKQTRGSFSWVGGHSPTNTLTPKFRIRGFLLQTTQIVRICRIRSL